jgi:nicotinamidase/pyrazinamidase
MRATPTPTVPTHRAAVVVDPQHAFTEAGALEVDGGDAVCRRIGSYLATHGDRYDLVVFTSDWHIEPGDHFDPETPDFVDTWPPHCVAATPGAALDDNLVLGANQAGLGILSPLALADRIVYKGQHQAAYSGFEGAAGDQTLAELLEAGADEAGPIEALDVMGIATSHCVRATVLDGRRLGYDTTVLADLCVGVTPELAAAALDEMVAAGAVVDESISA